MTTYEFTLTNGYTHKITSFGIAVEYGFEMRDFVTTIKVDGLEMSFEDLRAGCGQVLPVMAKWPHGKPMTFAAAEDRAPD